MYRTMRCNTRLPSSGPRSGRRLFAATVSGTPRIIRVIRRAPTAALAARAEADRVRGAAEARQREAAAVSDFLEAVLGSVNPWGAERASEVSVEQMVDLAAARLDRGSLAGQTDAEARVRATLGNAYVGLALPDRAQPQLRRALDLQRALHPRADHPDVARSMNAMASVLL